mgnify:CR=1 FL=1
MKIAELLEYKIHKDVNQAYTKDAIRQGDLYKDDLTFIKTLDPSIKVGYMKPNKEWLSIYLFVDDVCEGALEVEILGPHLEYFNDLKKQFGNRPFCKPCQFSFMLLFVFCQYIMFVNMHDSSQHFIP